MKNNSAPIIRPHDDFPNTVAASEYAREVNEPVFLTKEGRGDMVIMSMETYERELWENEIVAQIDSAEASLKGGAKPVSLSKVISKMEGMRDARG